ncbi:MAG: tyrosine-type recombinase/integrase [Bacteroidales bacterium]|nr:tyrosine-type recombinase/integrase [Candidatus Latescibacterota bacterium]
MAAKIKKLSVDYCKAATPKDGPTILDTVADKLVLKISPKGKKSWAVAGWIQGRSVSKKLGTFQAAPGKKNTPVQMGLDKAREAAKIALLEMDGTGEKYGLVAAAPAPEITSPTLGEFFDVLEKAKASGPKANTPATLAGHRQRFEMYVADFRVTVDGIGATLATVPLHRIEGFHLDDLKNHVIEKAKAREAETIRRDYESALAKWRENEAKIKAGRPVRNGRKHGPRPKSKPKPEIREPDPERGARTANLILSRLTTLFRYAIRRKVVPEGWTYPKVEVQAQEKGRDDTNHLKRQQARDFYTAVEALRHRRGYHYGNNVTAADALLTTLWTGGRIGNVCSMEWDELDLDGGEWRIPRSKYKARSRMATKDKVIPLVPPVVALLRSRVGYHRRWVFPNEETGTHIKQFRKSFDWVKAEAGITQRVTLHGLRHSLGTWLHQSGAPLKAIAGQLGHADLSSTQRYAHNETGHVAGLTSKAIEASYRVIEAEEIEGETVTLTADEWADVLETYKGTPLAARISSQLALRLVG